MRYLHTMIRVRDLPVSPKWATVTEGEIMILHVVAPRAEEVVAATEAAAPGTTAEPEVIKKGKTEKEEEKK